MPLPFLPAAVTTPHAQTISICKIAAHPERYLGKSVQVDGDLTDIEPHGVVLAAGGGSECGLEVGKVAGGTDANVLEAIHRAPNDGPSPIQMVAHVRIKGVIRSRRSEDFYGKRYTAYVLDEITISYRSEGR